VAAYHPLERCGLERQGIAQNAGVSMEQECGSGGNPSHAVAATLRPAPDQAKSPGLHAMSDESSACPGLSRGLYANLPNKTP
jgi:hypothetical protein